jgi:hypothetical protein
LQTRAACFASSTSSCANVASAAAIFSRRRTLWPIVFASLPSFAWKTTASSLVFHASNDFLLRSSLTKNLPSESRDAMTF